MGEDAEREEKAMWRREAEVGGVRLQTKECQGSLATSRSWERRKG